jgi:hypothetical protein
VVAKIWQHTDAAYPSDEGNIVRVQDGLGARPFPKQIPYRLAPTTKTSFYLWTGLLTVVSHAVPAQAPCPRPTTAYSAEGKTATVYITAADTDLRLAASQPSARLRP